MATKTKLTELQFAATELIKQSVKNNAEDGKLSKSIRDKLTKARRNLSDKTHSISGEDTAVLKGAWEDVKAGKKAHSVALLTLLNKWSKRSESGLEKFGDKNPFA